MLIRMPFRRFLSFSITVFILFTVLSCNDDWLSKDYDSTVQWNGGFKGPLIYGDLSLNDLLSVYDTTGYVSEDSTGLLYGAYSKDTVLRAPDLLKIPDQDFLQFFFKVDSTIPGFALGNIGDTVGFDQTKGFEFKKFKDERLDSLHIKSGSLGIYVSSTIKHQGILTMSSDKVLIQGQPYNEVIMISDPSGNFEETHSIDLSNSTLIFDNSVPDSTSLYINAHFDLINSGADIMPNEEIQIINSFQSLEFRGAYGYVGAFDSLLFDKAELEFDLLSGNFEGTIDLADARITMRTENYFGVPFGVELLDLEAHFQDGSGETIFIDPGANPITIAAPDITQIGQSVKDSTFINNTNSNLNIAATSDLTGLQYSLRALANPGGEVDNFILDDSELRINVEGLIPLDLRMEDVVLGDTFNFELSDTASDFSSDDIVFVRMTMKTTNSMPLDLGIQLYFVDSIAGWLPLDSLFGADHTIFKSGVTDDNGRVILPTSKETVIELTRGQISNLVNANKILMKAYVETAEGGTRDVKFYSGNSLKFSLGAEIEVSLKIEPDNNN